MEMIKKLVGIIVVVTVLSSVARVCAMRVVQEPTRYKNSDDEELGVNDVDMPVLPMSEREVAAVNRVAELNTKRAEEIFPFLSPVLPIDGVVKMVFDYEKLTRGDVALANKRLVKAVKSNNEQAVIAALSEGANPSKVVNKKQMYTGYGDVSSGESLLMKAAQEGHVGVIKALLEHKADVSMVDRHGSTVLHNAVTYRSPELSAYRATLVGLLVNNQACVNAVGGGMHTTPLIYAIRFNHTEVVKILMSAGADPEFIDWQKNSAWTEAEEKPEITQIMKEALQERALATAAVALLQEAVIGADEVEHSVRGVDDTQMVDEEANATTVCESGLDSIEMVGLCSAHNAMDKKAKRKRSDADVDGAAAQKIERK